MSEQTPDTPETVDAKMTQAGGIVGSLLQVFAPTCSVCGAKMRVVGQGLANLVYVCDHLAVVYDAPDGAAE